MVEKLKSVVPAFSFIGKLFTSNTETSKEEQVRPKPQLEGDDLVNVVESDCKQNQPHKVINPAVVAAVHQSNPRIASQSPRLSRQLMINPVVADSDTEAQAEEIVDEGLPRMPNNLSSAKDKQLRPIKRLGAQTNPAKFPARQLQQFKKQNSSPMQKKVSYDHSTQMMMHSKSQLVFSQSSQL